MMWLLRLFRRRKMEEELERELRYHLDRHANDLVAQGHSPEEAQRQARMTLGGPEQVKEAVRDVRRTRWLSDLAQDLRFGVRVLLRSKTMTAAATLSLALGIGANTAIFSLLDALLLKTLPVREPEQLVYVEGLRFAHPDPVYKELSEKNSVFAGMFSFHSIELTISSGGQAERVSGELVSGNFFTTLGVGPHLGRVFSEADDQTPGAHLVTVISYDFWRRRFNADPQIVGRKISVNNYPFTIIGVSAQGFADVEVGFAPDVRVPMMMKTQMLDAIDTTPVMARLKPGVSLEQAQAAIDPIFQNILQTFKPKSPVYRSLDARGLELRSARTGVPKDASNLRRKYSQSLFLLMGLVGVVLLIACLNVANLLIARAATRRKEIAVRLAMGAGRYRVVRQLLTEGFLLSMLGGVLGLAFARLGKDALLGFLSQNASLEINPDLRMLGFTLGVSMLTGLLFGLVPALQATSFDLIPALKYDGLYAVGTGRKWELRRLMVVLQVALSLVLLVGGGLFARSLRNLRAVDHGYTTDQIVTVEIAPDRSGYKIDQQQNLYTQLRERVTALPGVKAVTLGPLPLSGGNGFEGEIKLPGFQSPTNEKPTSLVNGISPQFFATFGIPLLQGRDFNAQDSVGKPKVIIVNDSFARFFFRDESPLGKHIPMGPFGNLEIVGVVGDAKLWNLKETMSRTFYYAQEQRHMGRQKLCVRTAGDVGALVAAIRREVRSLDQNLPIFNVKTFAEHIDESISRERMIAMLASFFSLFALLLAMLGLYGVMAFTVTRRTREIGVRMALGAQKRNILSLVLRETLLLVSIGIAIGLPVALAATRLTKGMLFGLTPNDPWTITLAAIVMIAVAALAGYLPARRATKVDPMTALRCD